jgi:CBS domain-containing protein
MKKKTFTVREAYHREKIRALVIDEDVPVEEVVRRFAKPRMLRAIFTVDAKGRLTGVVTRGDLLDYLKTRLGIWSRAARYPSWGRAIKYLHAKRAKDLVHKGSRDAYVRLNDDVVKALLLMIDHDLIDVPVLDSNGRIVGDIGVSDIMLKLLASSKP